MTRSKVRTKKRRRAKPLTMVPLSTEEALHGFLKVDPKKVRKRLEKEKKRSKGKKKGQKEKH